MSFAQLTRSVLLLFAVLAALPSSWAQTLTVLYEFTGHADGAFPISGVILDSAGNLYGTASSDGVGGYYGSVFKVTSAGKFNLLHRFPNPDKARGAVPVAGLTLDSAGNLYGTTSCGGSTSYLGTVFKLDNHDKFSVLYDFTEGWYNVGCFGGPAPGSLTLDAAGNLYGAGGGGNGTCNNGFYCGAVFKIDPSGKETNFHAFGHGTGWYPNLGLIRDTAGNLYGTTNGGGKYGVGVVFKLDSAGNETVLHSFQRSPDGESPNAGLVQDAAGNFYGTTSGGGLKTCHSGAATTCGVVFKIDTNGNETVFYSFTGGVDGENPWGALLIDPTGNLYGVAGGGKPGGGGVFFKIDTSGKETVLYNFAAHQGGYVTAMDSAGNFYGAAQVGGNPNDCVSSGVHGCGFVFKITP